MFLCYAAWIVMIGCSIREFLRENWIGAFYFLLACGFLAIWVELRKNKGTAQVYNNCQWFVNPQMGESGDKLPDHRLDRQG